MTVFLRIFYIACLFWTVFSNDTISEAEERWQKDVPSYEDAKVKIMTGGPTLLFSDSPEMVRDVGIMYRDKVTGAARIFFHHVNDTNENKRIAVIIKNIDTSPAVVTLMAQGISEPDYDYLKAGKAAQIAYFNPQDTKSHVLRTKGYVELTDSFGVIAQPGKLVTGIVDFYTKKQVEVTVLMLPVAMPLEDALAQLPVLPPDEGGHVLRGTFNLADRFVIMEEPYDSSRGVMGVVLADNEEDPYVRGIDATTGKPVINYGNYGVVYHFAYKIKNKGRTEIRLNPWGGLFAGAGRVNNGKNEVTVLFPKDHTAFGVTGKETIVIDSVDGDSMGTIIFSPPGSSNLPIRFFFEKAAS